MIVAAFVLILALVAIVAVALALRLGVKDEERTESRLRDPHTHTLTYAIPNGVDPIAFAVAVRRAGYVSIVEDLGAAQGLRVACDVVDREKVRRVIATVAVTDYDGTTLKLDHVVFEDER